MKGVNNLIEYQKLKIEEGREMEENLNFFLHQKLKEWRKLKEEIVDLKSNTIDKSGMKLNEISKPSVNKNRLGSIN